MSSFLWLLLYLAPLLGLTAALFAWFGWQWRGSDMQKRINELTTQIDTAQAALQRAEAAHAAIPTESPVPQGPSTAEVQALQDGLKSAQTEARLYQDEAAKAREAARAHATEMERLLADLEQLRAERASAQAELAAAQAKHASAEAELASLRNASAVVETVAEGTTPAKAKRKRSTVAKPKAAAAAAPGSLREKIAALEAQLVTHEAGLSTLMQERDDWQGRLRKLEEESPADPAGLALARRSFADSDKRLTTTTTEIERLQNQTRVLLRIEEAAATLTGVPDDDLTQIKGIKKIISEQLRTHGIRTWRQIALWDEAELRAFSELLAFKSRATREQWQEQARALHEAAHGLLI